MVIFVKKGFQIFEGLRRANVLEYLLAFLKLFYVVRQLEILEWGMGVV